MEVSENQKKPLDDLYSRGGFQCVSYQTLAQTILLNVMTMHCCITFNNQVISHNSTNFMLPFVTYRYLNIMTIEVERNWKRREDNLTRIK